MKKFYAIAVMTAAVSALFAEIKMPAIFSSGMVFQQQKPINVWGTAKPNSEVMVMFDFKNTTVKADANGNWHATLPKAKASFNPLALTVFEDKIPGATFYNIYVGEVWIAGGQSNMEWCVASTDDFKGAKASADKSAGKIRYFKQSSNGFSKLPKTEFQKGAQWQTINSKNVHAMTAVGFYFAEKLLKDLNVPVGIIYSSKGAASMATWSDRTKLLENKITAKKYADFFKELDAYDAAAYQKLLAAHKEKMAKYEAKVKECKAVGKPAPTVAWDFKYAPTEQSPKTDYKSPSLHFNGKVVPMRDFTARGVIWYQGESDASDPEFCELFKVLLDSWRSSLKDADLPFIQVQLASYSTKANWPWARSCQFRNTQIFKNVYMAPIIDTGEEFNIHPHFKSVVGYRMETIALEKVYGKKGVCSDAPVMKSVVFKGDTATVEFETFKGVLKVDGKPRGFETMINGKWSPAQVSIDGKKAVVKSSDGSEVRGVRYAWKNWAKPDVCLFGENGFPAIPFESLK